MNPPHTAPAILTSWALHVALHLCCGEAAYEAARPRNNLPWQSESLQDQSLVQHIFRNRRFGFFVELGAADGKHFSNTYALEHGMNWTGILIEPVESEALRCAENRPGSICVHACVAGKAGLHSFLEHKTKPLESGLLHYHDGIPRFDPNHSQNIEEKEMECTTLPEILKQHGAPSHIDWLSLDVEASEEALESQSACSKSSSHSQNLRYACGDVQFVGVCARVCLYSNTM